MIMVGLSDLVDKKIVKLLTVLYTNKKKFYHITQLSQESQVPAATTLRLIGALVSSNIVTVSNVGKLKIYSYNDSEQNNDFMKVLNI